MKRNSRTLTQERRRSRLASNRDLDLDVARRPRTDEAHLADTDSFVAAGDEDGDGLIDEEQAAMAEAAEHDNGQAPDDTLGLYLRQMGAIPLLNRKEELDLSQRLETARKRYRHAGLLSMHVLGRVVSTFERVLAGQLAVDPTIDVVTSLGLSREKILARMPHNVRTLRRLLGEADDAFRMLLRASTPASRLRIRRTLWRIVHKSAVLAEELSPRIDLLDRWTDELQEHSAKMSHLDRQIGSSGRSRVDREERTKRTKE